MEVILLERVPGLGDVGAVVKVKDGFARNYLIPRKKVLRATTKNKADVEQKKLILEQQHIEKREKAQANSLVLANSSVSLIRQAGEDGKLYGSVTSKDIAKSLCQLSSLTIASESVLITNKIRNVGVHSVTVSLHPDVSFQVTVNVARSEQEAAALSVKAVEKEPVVTSESI